MHQLVLRHTGTQWTTWRISNMDSLRLKITRCWMDSSLVYWRFIGLLVFHWSINVWMSENHFLNRKIVQLRSMTFWTSPQNCHWKKAKSHSAMSYPRGYYLSEIIPYNLIETRHLWVYTVFTWQGVWKIVSLNKISYHCNVQEFATPARGVTSIKFENFMLQEFATPVQRISSIKFSTRISTRDVEIWQPPPPVSSAVNLFLISHLNVTSPPPKSPYLNNRQPHYLLCTSITPPEDELQHQLWKFMTKSPCPDEAFYIQIFNSGCRSTRLSEVTVH